MPQVHKRGGEGQNRSSKKFHSSHDCPQYWHLLIICTTLVASWNAFAEQVELDSRYRVTGIRQQALCHGYQTTDTVPRVSDNRHCATGTRQQALCHGYQTTGTVPRVSDNRHCATGIRQPLKLTEFRDQP